MQQIEGLYGLAAPSSQVGRFETAWSASDDNLADFMRALALPRRVARWPLTTCQEKLVKIGARMARHDRCVTFRMVEVAVSARLFGQSLSRITRLRAPPVLA